MHLNRNEIKQAVEGLVMGRGEILGPSLGERVVLDLRLVMLLLLRLLFGSAPMDQLEDDDDDDNVLPGRAPHVICIFHSVLKVF